MALKHGVIDATLMPFAAAGALAMRRFRKYHSANMPLTFNALRRIGIFPVTAHYYEPKFDFTADEHSDAPRDLPGIDFAIDRQLAMLRTFDDVRSLEDIPSQPSGNDYHFDNVNFSAGDAEIWFHMIRHLKPARILEIGSGFSTRMARMAIDTLTREDSSYRCEHVCIEPYEMPWLEELGITIVRSKLEDSDPTLFVTLKANDILFIDSSHIIRPGGEVLLEYLQLLPVLAPGVVIHIHDIFTPREYPKKWLTQPRFWNEQYLLEALLTGSQMFEVMLGLNMLKNDHYDALKAVCPHLTPNHAPGSFYIRKTG